MSGDRWGGWWRWPLWSWKHLTVSLVAVALAIAALGHVSDQDATIVPAVVDAASQEQERAPTKPPASQPLDQVPGSSQVPAAAVIDARPQDIALSFVRSWARPDADSGQWRRTCQTLATERYGKELATASSAHVPSSRVLGAAHVQHRTKDAAQVRVPTDGGAVLVDLELTNVGWRVAMIEPERLASDTLFSRG